MKANRNRIIAVYIIWAFLHLILFLTSGNSISMYDSRFFPFPFFIAHGEYTYSYMVYKDILNIGVTEKTLGTYSEFCNKINNKNKIDALYKVLHRFSPWTYSDSSYFFEDMRESFEKYGDKKYYTVYGNLFPEGYSQYDYSEFIIYLLLPLVLIYFKKLWVS